MRLRMLTNYIHIYVYIYIHMHLGQARKRPAGEGGGGVHIKCCEKLNLMPITDPKP